METFLSGEQNSESDFIQLQKPFRSSGRNSIFLKLLHERV